MASPRSREPLTFGDEAHPAGSFVIKGRQPYFRLAKTLLGNPEFPDDGLRTYDDTGWTMGLMHRTVVAAIDDPAILGAPVDPLDETQVTVTGTIAGDGTGRYGYAVAHYGSNHLTTLRYRLGAMPVDATEERFEVAGVELPPGSLIIPAPVGSERARQAREWIAELGLTAAAGQHMMLCAPNACAGQQQTAQMMTDDILRFARGDRPVNLVNPEVWDRPAR